MTLTACPVKLFAGDVSTLFDLFYLTHEFTRGAWRRTSLPAAGGIGDQPALELAGIREIATAWNRRLREKRRPEVRGRE